MLAFTRPAGTGHENLLLDFPAQRRYRPFLSLTVFLILGKPYVIVSDI